MELRRRAKAGERTAHRTGTQSARPSGKPSPATKTAIEGGVVHRMPDDLRDAIVSDAVVKGVWADITPLARNEWICWVTSAKKDETRSRRITVGLDKMRKGMRRPCCWPGCPHR